MNHIYRSIWSQCKGTFVATSEHAAGAGHPVSSSAKGHEPSRHPTHRRLLSVSLLLAWGVVVQAAPSGGAVTAGSAVLGGTPGQMTVHQTTEKVAIQWQSFGIASGQSVQFVQPSRASVALNRVVGSDPSAILGSLSSNGQVFLVNPHGILFGPGASVNVGGLVASTLAISDTDLMAGRYRFSGAGSGEVVNQGHIRAADGGYVAMLGAHVNNQGVVVAQRGSVALAAGDAMTLDVSGDRLLNVVIDRGVADALAHNGAWLQADGGQVLMSTQVAGHLLSNAVNNTGVIQAQTLENRQGAIVLVASMDSGTVNLGGQLDVRGVHGQAAGRVVATGRHVGLFNAQIDASGDAGGGVVLIGGDYQGRNPEVPHALAVHMSADSRIQADAQVQGEGGRVVLWSDGSTRALGQVSARGGATGGDGGVVETSGHGLDVSGARVDTRAPQGQTGSWLLDPADITISSSATSDGAVSGGVFSPNSGVNSANINVADLVTALGGTHVIVTTQNSGVGGTALGDIHVNAAVTWTNPTTLTLNAARDVNVNQAITGTNGSLAAIAGRNVNVGAVVTTTTGNLSFTAVQDVNLSAATTITTGNLTAVAGRNVSVSAASTVTTGNMVFRADNDGTGPGVPAGTVSITCGIHCLTVGTGVLSIRFNPSSYASTSSEILAYAGRLTGGGTLDAKAWVFGAGDNKMYDANTSATVSGLLPDVSSVAPPVSLGAVSNANFDTRHVGTDKPITFETTFADAAYALFAPSGSPVGTYQARADVLVRPLTVTAVTDTRAYNGTTSSVGAPTAVGVQSGDILTGTLTQAYASKDVMGTGNSTLVASGTYAVTDGNGGNNYAVSVVTAPGTITPIPLTITAIDVAKVYGQTPVLTGYTTSALVASESVGSVSLTSPGQAATASVGGSPYAITPSAASGGSFTPSNYSVVYVDGVLTVAAATTVPPVSVPGGTEPTGTLPTSTETGGALNFTDMPESMAVVQSIDAPLSLALEPVSIAFTEVQAAQPNIVVMPVMQPVPPQPVQATRAQEEKTPPRPALVVPVRPPKQDRN